MKQFETTLRRLLDYLDGRGIIVTDEELIDEAMVDLKVDGEDIIVNVERLTSDETEDEEQV
jgi:hypothetical protein